MMGPLIKHVISLVVARFHPHIFMRTSFAMSCICASRLWGRFRFVFLSVFSSPKTHHLKVFGSNLEMLGDSQPPPIFWNTCSYFFWHRNNHKKIKKIKNTRNTQMLGYLPKRDIKVPPLLVNHHDLFILTCCYQKSHLIFFKKWKVGFWEGVDTGDLN